MTTAIAQVNRELTHTEAIKIRRSLGRQRQHDHQTAEDCRAEPASARGQECQVVSLFATIPETLM